MSDKIAFIGVGNMGNPMAENLLKSGKRIRVFDTSNKMIELAKKKGLNTVDSIDTLKNFMQMVKLQCNQFNRKIKKKFKLLITM